MNNESNRSEESLGVEAQPPKLVCTYSTDPSRVGQTFEETFGATPTSAQEIGEPDYGSPRRENEQSKADAEADAAASVQEPHSCPKCGEPMESIENRVASFECKRCNIAVAPVLEETA